MKWYGVMPAMTTCFDKDLKVDHPFMTRHVEWLMSNGCTGVIALGSLGEAATLTLAEKDAILRNAVASAKKAPVVAAISALSTEEAVELAKLAEKAGCSGLMVLPPYVYLGDWREMKAHVGAIIGATSLSCMLYNNPVSYGTDFLPEQIAELAKEHENLAAVKESSTDVRRVTAIRALTGDRLRIFVGVDDVIVEGVAAGAVGWVAGLVNAFPAESVALFEAAVAGKWDEAFALSAGFCLCCAWTRCRSLSNSSSRYSRRRARATRGFVRRALKSSAQSWKRRGRAVKYAIAEHPPAVRSTPISDETRG